MITKEELTFTEQWQPLFGALWILFPLCENNNLSAIFALANNNLYRYYGIADSARWSTIPKKNIVTEALPSFDYGPPDDCSAADALKDAIITQAQILTKPHRRIKEAFDRGLPRIRIAIMGMSDVRARNSILSWLDSI